ncbi:MAG: hypothetical protein AB1589_32955 [Cyanobacteriota bacterium]
MYRVPGSLNQRKAPGFVFNAMVVVAFVMGLFCYSMPGLHLVLKPNILNVLLAPLYFLAFIHLTALLALMALPPWLSSLGTADSLITYVSAIFFPCMLLWLVLVWLWILHRLIPVEEISVQRWQRLKEWFAPIMLWVLSILWATHIPLSVNFALHKSGFEKLADRAMAKPSGFIDFTPVKPMGIFFISGAFRQSKTIASIETTSEHGLWAHEGFVRDLSRKPDGFKANTYSLAPYSNNGDQDIFYLGDGWYVFQNLID